MADLLSQLTDNPVRFPDLCLSLSRPLIHLLAAQLPHAPAKILSIGSGSGLLENALLHVTKHTCDLYGVEVSSAVNRHLPEDRLLQVAGTGLLHPDAIFAELLMFVYPRQPSLLASYLSAFSHGMLEKVIWLGPRIDWPDAEPLLSAVFNHVEILDGPYLPEYELLVIAKELKTVARPSSN
ncbi:Hypothetical protein R9X50_00119600 [Acrodontium crateriforme]|uniref:Uncharacterized protein n=1 Tax=Acrodontium crateriforme TaxID=150365 RepID=A0AAQ3LYL6_9PEZI|nr:Hypothetical protein R9X50_00119600 [Acrodontium crateriforme]